MDTVNTKYGLVMFSMRRVILLLIFVLVAHASGAATRVSPQEIYFDDSDIDLIRLGNDSYEVVLRKLNGAVVSIEDKEADAIVSTGSNGDCLWGANFDREEGEPNYIGGCNYAPGNSNSFEYTWNAAAHRLTMTYLAGPQELNTVDAWVDLTLSDASYFDMRIIAQNKSDSNLMRMLFPAELKFTASLVEEALLPIIPGVVLNQGFFEQERRHESQYPTWHGGFSDLLAIDFVSGFLSLYSLHEGDYMPVSEIGYISIEGDEAIVQHVFQTAVTPNSEWSTPTVRVHVGRNFEETAQAHRSDTHLDSFPNLRDKLGADYDRLVKSPHVKIDYHKEWEDLGEQIDRIPYGLLHWVSYWWPTFDENYPDFVPQDPDTLLELFQRANDNGLFNMPYTNPTWWDDESPTMQALMAEEVAVIDSQGEPVYECFGQNPRDPECTIENAARDSEANADLEPHQWLHGGYAVSPYAPDVQARLEQLMNDLTTELPSDFIFEDQVGAGTRGWHFLDYNAASPFPYAFLTGWQNHTATYESNRLMTEIGYDQLAKSETGFHGSLLLLDETGGFNDEHWGTGNWSYYPLAPMLVRDKVLFYQHNLAPETFTTDLETLTWNLSMGYQLSYMLNKVDGGGLESDWFNVVMLFQSALLSPYAGERLQHFTRLNEYVSETRFESFSVVSNQHPDAPYVLGGHTLSAGGAIVCSDDGNVVGGVFDAYNDQPLNGGEQYLIEQRGADAIDLYHPKGVETTITLNKLAVWADNELVMIEGYQLDGTETDVISTVVSDGTITFNTFERSSETVHYHISKDLAVPTATSTATATVTPMFPTPTTIPPINDNRLWLPIVVAGSSLSLCGELGRGHH